MRERLAAGEIDLLIGTTALNNEDDRFRSLGLVIVDEQHRFGVRQRAQLGKKDSGAGQFHELEFCWVARFLSGFSCSHVFCSGVRQCAQLGKKDSGACQFHKLELLGRSVFV